MIDEKILAGYLPYELQFSGGSDIWTMIGLANNGDVVLKNGLYAQAIDAANVGLEYKPMLKPFTEFDVKEFIDERHREMSEAIHQFIDYLESDVSNIYSAILAAPFVLIEFCHKKHYDIYDLIGQGLAVTKIPQP